MTDPTLDLLNFWAGVLFCIVLLYWAWKGLDWLGSTLRKQKVDAVVDRLYDDPRRDAINAYERNHQPRD
jgi:hypothetical protein